jgi:hypothetical protein
VRNATGDGQDTGGNNRECRSKSAWWKVFEVEETHGRGRGDSEGEWMMRWGEGPHGQNEERLKGKDPATWPGEE